MRNTFLFFVFLLSPLLFFAQAIEPDSVIVTIEGPKAVFNLDLRDSLDIPAIDSLIAELDTLLNDLSPSPEVYGHEIFRNDSIKIFTPGDIVKVPDSYVLGIGDEIAISIFGISQLDAKLRIDSSGFVEPATLPKIYLKGIKWGQARQLLQRRFSSYYRFRSDQFAATLSNPRKITVNIFGEVERPGSYQVEATNTAFNTLFAAGGPTNNGSIRGIKVYKGQNMKTLDIYDIFFDPGVQFDFYLEDNIIVFVPPLGKTVSIEGAVPRPMKFEVEESEGIIELIKFAGGLNPEAVKEIVQIRRFEDDRFQLIDINLQELIDNNLNYPLNDGDEISIKSVERNVREVVSAEGAVELPGEYSLVSTKRISDLLTKSILKREAQLDLAFLVRLNPDSTLRLIEVNLQNVLANPGETDDLLLEPKDKLVVNDQNQLVDRSTISVRGEVRKKISYPFDPSSQITLRQAVLLAGGLGPEARNIGYIIRTNPENQNEKEYLEIDIKDAIANRSGASNLVLQPWDEVFVLRASNYTDIITVGIKGAVRNQGEFQYDPSLKLKDLIVLAGGLRPEASTKLQVFRLETDQNQPSRTVAATIEIDEALNIIAGPENFRLMPFDEVVVRKVPGYEMQTFINIKGEILYPGEYALTSKNETILSLVNRAGGLTTEAFPEGASLERVVDVNVNPDQFNYYKVVTRLDEALKSELSQYNFILKKGDIFTIPKKEDVVYINMIHTKASEVNPAKYDSTTIAVTFEPGKSAKWYIDEFAGGFGHDADKNSVTVEYANGAVKRSKGGLFKKYPIPGKGSTIAIGKKYDRKKRRVADESSGDSANELRPGVIVNVGADKSVEKKELNDGGENN